MSENPYAAPEANVERPPESGGSHDVAAPRSVAAGRGWEWIAGGFRYFSASPLMWIVGLLVWLLIMIVVALIPIVNFALTVISPAIIAGFMIGCAAQDRGESLTLNHALAGFQNNTSQLLVVGGLYLAGSLLLGIVAVALMFVFGGAGALALAAGGEVASVGAAMAGIAIALLITVALSVPLLMAIYFAAPLVALGNLQAVDALKMSFSGCLRNMLPFLVFGIILLLLSILAAIPLLLGYLVLFPVMIAAGYAAYKDIFIHREDVALGPS